MAILATLWSMLHTERKILFYLSPNGWFNLPLALDPPPMEVIRDITGVKKTTFTVYLE